MNKVLEGSVSVYHALAVRSHHAEANHLTEEAKVREPGVIFELAVKRLDLWQSVYMRGRKGQKRRAWVFVVVENLVYV
jgi:hypothetical protein